MVEINLFKLTFYSRKKKKKKVNVFLQFAFLATTLNPQGTGCK